MSDVWENDIPHFELPAIDVSGMTRKLNAANAIMNATLRENAEHQRRKDEALLQTAEASKAQQELLEQQLLAVQAQNQQLIENNALLKSLYESARANADSSAKDAKANMRLAWISIIIGAVIGIVGIVVGTVF